jgi:hypothetical protein
MVGCEGIEPSVSEWTPGLRPGSTPLCHAAHAWRMASDSNARCRLSTDTPVFRTGDFTIRPAILTYGGEYPIRPDEALEAGLAH